MQLEAIIQRRTDAAREFDAHERRADGEHLVSSLSHGLSLLRDQSYTRFDQDVCEHFGVDSVQIPVSIKDMETKAKIEIELFLAAAAVSAAVRRRYVADRDWFGQWLLHLRLGDVAEKQYSVERMAKYLAYDDEDRRLSFSNVLSRTLPSAHRAPLVLFQLLPHAVTIVVATAFGDSLTAAEARNRQISHLPSISECHECHGRPLDNGERCNVCHNPVWSYEWLTETG
ncbi:MAG: hypothetical protein RIC55_01530 [Pirellulaceae bacterium]